MLRAEFARWRRSSLLAIPIIGLAFGFLQFVVLWGAGSSGSWDRLIAGNVLWATSLSVPVSALLLSLVQLRERRARGGGTWWRVGSNRTTGICRMFVTALMMFATNVLVLAPTAIIGALASPAAALLTRLITLAGVMTLGSILLYPVFELLSARWGITPSLILSVAWLITGLVTAESRSWVWNPTAWPIRALLPLLKTHANGIALEPGDPLQVESPGLAIGLTTLGLLLLAAVYLILAGASYGKSSASRVRRISDPTRQHLQDSTASFATLPAHMKPRGHARPLLASLRSLKRSSLTWLIPALFVVLIAVIAIWRNPHYSTGVFDLAMVPVTGTLLGLFGWTTGQDAWRTTAATGTEIYRLVIAKLTALEYILIATTAISCIALVLSGVGVDRAIRGFILGVSVGWMLLVGTHWLTARWSPGLAAIVQGIGLVFSLVLGAGALATQFWPIAAWAWAHTPASLAWPYTALVSLLAVGIGWAFVPLTIRAARRRASQE